MSASRETARANPLLGYAAVLAGALFIGVMPNAAKLSYAEGANPLLVLVARAMIGVVVPGVWLMMRRQTVLVPRDFVFPSAIGGAVFGLTALGGMTAIAYIDVSLATIFFFIYPVPVALVQHLTGVTRLTAKMLGLMVLSLVGLGMALGISFERLDPRGIGLALVAVVSVTVMILTVSRTSAALGAVRSNLHMSLWAAIYFIGGAVILPAIGAVDPIRAPSGAYGWTLVAVSGLSFTVGYLFFFTATTIIGATRASALSIVEALMMILLAVAWVGEHLTPVQWFGVILSLGALGAMEAFPGAQGEAQADTV